MVYRTTIRYIIISLWFLRDEVSVYKLLPIEGSMRNSPCVAFIFHNSWTEVEWIHCVTVDHTHQAFRVEENSHF